MFRALAIAAGLALLAGPAAFADEAIPTAGDSGAKAPTTGAEVPPLDPPGGSGAGDERLVVSPCGVVHPQGEKVDGKAHGSVEVGVGTGGYRHVRATVCQPVGHNGAVVVDVERTEWGRRARLAGYAPEVF